MRIILSIAQKLHTIEIEIDWEQLYYFSINLCNTKLKKKTKQTKTCNSENILRATLPRTSLNLPKKKEKKTLKENIIKQICRLLCPSSHDNVIFATSLKSCLCDFVTKHFVWHIDIHAMFLYVQHACIHHKRKRKLYD